MADLKARLDDSDGQHADPGHGAGPGPQQDSLARVGGLVLKEVLLQGVEGAEVDAYPGDTADKGLAIWKEEEEEEEDIEGGEEKNIIERNIYIEGVTYSLLDRFRELNLPVNQRCMNAKVHFSGCLLFKILLSLSLQPLS